MRYATSTVMDHNMMSILNAFIAYSPRNFFCLVATACKMSVKNNFTDVKHLKFLLSLMIKSKAFTSYNHNLFFFKSVLNKNVLASLITLIMLRVKY